MNREKPMRTRIENITLLTLNGSDEVLRNASITFEDDTIIALNQNLEVDSVIDGKQSICMPGMVNTHAHFPMIPFRSLQDDRPDRLRKFLLPLERLAMDAKLAEASCKVAIAESLLSGVTTVFDMYYFPEVLARCYKDLNMRAMVAETVMKEPTCDTDEPHGGLELSRSFIKNWLNDDLITPALGPHGTTTVDPEVMHQLDDLAKEFGLKIQMHVSEMDYEMNYFKDKYGMTPIEYLDSIGLLSERLILGHGIHIQGKDFELIRKYGCSVAHCLGSNTKAAKGVAPIKQLRELGIEVGLGTDGPSSGNTLDLFAQMSLFAKVHKLINHDRTVFPAHEIVRLATLGGAKTLGMDHSIGSLEVGKKADIVLVETRSPNMFPVHDPFSVLVYSANPSNISDVWVNGVQVVRDKRLVKADADALIRDCAEAMTVFNREAARISAEL